MNTMTSETKLYDSKADTEDHIRKVAENMLDVRMLLGFRARIHDESKLRSPEKEIFDKVTPKLRGLTYGSEEYEASLEAMKPALDHHYKHNSHHPEHYIDGVNGMCLIDLIEMLCDWKAATERHADGSLAKSLVINQRRFNIDEQLQSILINTAHRLGWAKAADVAKAKKNMEPIPVTEQTK